MKSSTIGIIVVVVLVLFGAAFFFSQSQGNTQPSTTQPTKQMAKEDGMMEKDESMEEMNIVETAVAADDFNTLVTAVQAAGLVETLSGEGPFTVFAPTDAAFEALPEGTLEAVLADPEQLTSILTYHVVPGKVMAADVVNLTEAPTVQGGVLTVDASEDGVMINGAKVITTDIETSNGVIHVIDAVLLPE